MQSSSSSGGEIIFTNIDGEELTGSEVLAVSLSDDATVSDEEELTEMLMFRAVLKGATEVPPAAVAAAGGGAADNEVEVKSKDEQGNVVGSLTLQFKKEGDFVWTDPILWAKEGSPVGDGVALTGDYRNWVSVKYKLKEFKPNPDVYNFQHSTGDYEWQNMLDKMGAITSYSVECSDTEIQATLASIVVTGISTDPNEPQFQEYVEAAQYTNSKIIPAYDTPSQLLDIGHVVLAMAGIATEANRLRDVSGRVNKAIGYSAGCQTIVSSALINQLYAKQADLFGPVLLVGNLEQINSIDSIYVYRCTGDAVGWLGYFQLYFDFTPSGDAMFSIRVNFGSSGNVRYIDTGNYKHTGPNGIRKAIPALLKKYRGGGE